MLYTEFVKKNYIGLLGPIIRSDKCIKSINLLNSILETACSLPVITRTADIFELLPTKNVCIIYADLFIAVINHCCDWYNKNNENCRIIEMLFMVIQALVSEKHLYQATNISRLNKANLLPALLNFCKVHQTDGAHSKFLSPQAADLLINIISTLAGTPPPSALLDDIVKVLLMLHRPSESFVTHDRSKFYFLLTSALQKSKEISLPLASRKIRLTFRKDFHASRNKNSPVGSPKQQGLDRFFDRSAGRKKNSSERSSVDGDVHNDENRVESLSDHGLSSDRLSDERMRSSDPIDMICRSPNIENRSIVSLNANDNTRFEKALTQINFKRHQGHKKRLNSRRKGKGRVRTRSFTAATPSGEEDGDETERKSKRRSISERGSSIGKGKDLELIKEYDIIADEDIRKIDEMLNKCAGEDKPMIASVIPADTSEGIIHIQTGLLKLLRDFVLILPDTAVGEVLSHYVTFEIVLVLANNRNASVRAAIILLLAVMCDRHTAVAKPINFFHLGNQISLHPTEFSLVQACVQWVTGSFLSMEQLVLENDLKVMHKWGLNSLIAIIPQTIHDIGLAQSILKFMNQLYLKSDQDSCSYMVENGLLPSVLKTLSKIHVKWGFTCEKLLEAMQNFLNTIALKAISTAGCINVLWDLLNGITFMEQNKSGAVFRGIRMSQATIIVHLIKAFFKMKNNPTLLTFRFHSSELNLSDSILSHTEKRTRFELLLDRTIQYLQNAHPSHTPSPQESILIESMVMLAVNGFTRTSSIIPWIFRPGKPMPIKLYVLKLLWKHARSTDVPLGGCDYKIVKTMIHAFLQTDKEIIPPSDYEILLNVCNTLGIKTSDSNSYLPHAIEKMDSCRESSIKEQRPYVERSIFKFEQTAAACIDSAMKITRNVVEIQNTERRGTMTHIRTHEETCLKQEWNLIIDRMTHEGAPWHCSTTYSK